MMKFARTSRPWLAAFALAASGVVGCAGNGNNTTTVGMAGTTGAAGNPGSAGTTTPTAGTTGAAGTTGTAGSGDTAGTTGAAGTTGGAGNPGSAGTTTPTAGTTGTAGAGAGGTTGTAGTTGAAGGSATGFTGPFDCTQIAGLLVTQEWYTSGFENDGVDNTKWESNNTHYGYINEWASPTGIVWGKAPYSACTKNAGNPDRVIWTAWSWELAYMTDKYAMTTAQGVRQFFTTFPGIKRLDLMTIVRCPPDPAKPETAVSGRHCNPNAQIPPIPNVTDHNAGQQDCYVNAEVDTALDMVAAMPEFAGKVFVGKKFYSPACRMPVDGAHLAGNNTQVAKDIAAWYNDPTHP